MSLHAEPTLNHVKIIKWDIHIKLFYITRIHYIVHKYNYESKIAIEQ